ncbi:hypothetical protein Acr_25g0006730 [Actinidia rufa]|uniref:Uncharacterized protein n=1 Tax=Actinidia rufa TaxID=165716 RepID=A0A7J0H0F6_9ERIC|nr:hypothetical protein Acr_25g0006730 [Actinidia rufa]
MTAFMYSHSLQSLKVHSGGHFVSSRREYPAKILKRNSSRLVSACIPKLLKDLSLSSSERNLERQLMDKCECVPRNELGN